MYKSRLLRISSSQRSNPDEVNTNDFSVSFDNLGSLQKVHSIVVKHVSFTNTFYNINQYNNVLILEDGKTTTITVPEGNYSIRDLLNLINPQMPSNNTFTYSPITNKITVTASASHPIELKGDGTMNKVLGFPSQDSGMYVSDTEAPYQLQLQGIQHVYLQSRVLSNGNNLLEGNENQEEGIFAMIPCDVPFGAIKHYESVHDTLDVINYHSSSGINTQKIDIRLVDKHKRLLDTSCHEVNVVLKVFFE